MSFTASSGALAVIAVALGIAAADGAQAYTLSQAATPAETPPASYSEDVYVDSRGCVYVRASIGTTVNWVPRLSRDRETVVCNLTPSLNAGATTAVAPAAPAPIVPATPAPLAQTSAPIGTAAQATPQVPAPEQAPLAGTPQAPLQAPALADAVPATLPAAQPTPLGAPVEPPVQAAAAPVTPPAPKASGEVVRTVEVTCPTAGANIRVRVGGDTVRLRCPAGMSGATPYLVTHADGSRSRVVAHRSPASGFGPSTSAAPVLASNSARKGAHAGTGPAVAPGARWVQVGAFGVSGNATRAIANLQGLGYGAATARTRSGLTVVLAGPFDDASELNRALRSLRGYYPDAYTRG